MNDTEMLDWINEHFVSLRLSLRNEDNLPYDMEWMDSEGDSHIIRGANIRHCINEAVKE